MKIKIGILVCLLSSLGIANVLHLESDHLRMEISPENGSVQGLWREKQCLARSIVDQYTLETKIKEILSSEQDDTVMEIKEQSPSRIHLICRNKSLRLKIEKIYSFIDGQFSKR